MIANKEKNEAAAVQNAEEKPAVHKAVKCPTKVGINLNMREKRTGEFVRLGIGCAVAILVVALVGKFGVYDQYQRLADAEAAYGQVHKEYEEVRQELSGYDEVLTEYRSYSMDWMTNSDDSKYQYVSVDRRDVLDLVESEMMTRGTVNSVLVRNDLVSVSMSGMSLEEISVMFGAIEQRDIVERVDLDVAETEKDMPASIMSFSVNITLKTEEADTTTAEEAAE